MAENPEQPKVMANVSRPSASASNVTSRGGSMSPSLSNNSASNHNLFINSSSSSPVMGSSQHGGAAAGADGGPVASEGFPRGGGESGGEDVDSQSDVGKIFVGGLNWLTTPDTLREYFGKFGPVSECVIMRSPLTHKSRGFGFVTFVEPSDVDKVLNILIHQVDGKKIDPKLAVPRRSQLPQKVAIVTRTKKAFVGGISTTTTQEDLQAYFSTFGTVEDATLMYDKATKRHRGFGFISFASEDVVDTVCEIHYHEINGKVVECKKAQPREVLSPSNSRSRAASLFGFRRNGLYHPRGAGYPGFGLFPPFYPGLPAYLGFYPGFGGDRHGFFDYSLTMPNFAPSSSNLFASGSSGVASSRRTEDVNETDTSREGALSNRNSGFSNGKQGSRQYSTSSSPPYPTSNSLTHPYSAKMLSSLSPLIGTTNPLDMSSLTRALPKDSQYLQNLSLQNYLHQNASAASAHTRPLPSNYTGPNGPPAISNPATRSMGPTPTSHLTNPHVPSKSHSSSSVEDSAVTRVPTVYNNGSA